jgi:hypothetical protein
MSKKGGGDGAQMQTGSTTTTTQTAPWSAQQPYLTFGFQKAQDLYNQGGPQYFPDATVAPVAPETGQALDLLAQRAQAGSPVAAAAQNSDLATLNGNYLGAGNPYFQQMIGNIANAVTPQIAGNFEGTGRYGSGAYANALTSALANSAANLAYQNYGDERRNMMQAAALAPSLANLDYTDLQQLANVGDMRRQLAQQDINAAIDRYNYNQNLPYNNLANYMRMIQGNYGSSATQTTENSVNPIAGSLGFANSGVNLLGQLVGLDKLWKIF